MSNLIPSLESFVKGTAATAAGLGTLGVGLLYYGQNYLIYPSAFPSGSREHVSTPSEFGLPYTDLTLTAPDGIKLKCYLLTQKVELDVHGANGVPWNWDEDGGDEVFAGSRPTVVMFHGNGGNAGHRIPLARVFFLKMRCNVLMLSYRGYGLSTGTPSERGLQLDAQTALDHITNHPFLSSSPIILYGQSIGGAVSIDLCSKNTKVVKALVLENTFTSLPRVIPAAMPWLGPFAFLCHQKWESFAKVPRIPPDIPVLLLGGVRDELVPRQHMHELWRLFCARGKPSTNTNSRISSLSSKEKPQPPPTSPSSNSKPWSLAAGRGAALADPSSASAPGEPSKSITAQAAHELGGTPSEKGDGDREGEDGLGEPVSLRDGKNQFLEFGAGTHNDTCVQPGYWHAVAEFIAALQDRPAESVERARERALS
ncbi:alpha/beta-hydrolase [Peniophora sp. CONT]|nr:alpha/beta-hydrolase [Peniophora sp. CONT]